MRMFLVFHYINYASVDANSIYESGNPVVNIKVILLIYTSKDMSSAVL